MLFIQNHYLFFQVNFWKILNEGLIVCQFQTILEGDSVIHDCCTFNIIKCPFIIIKYGKGTEYSYGFIKDDKGEENKYRTDIIDYIKDEHFLFKSNRKFNNSS